MTRSVTVSLYALGLLLLAPLGVPGQSRGVEMFPSDRRGPRHNDEGARPGPPVRDLYPSRPAVPDALGFIAPFSRETTTGRSGLAVWTVPNVPAGSRGAANPDNPGSLGFGLAAQWGGPAGRVRD
jgi:hypothetical protein